MYSIQSDCRGSDPCILPFWTEALENYVLGSYRYRYYSNTHYRILSALTHLSIASTHHMLGLLRKQVLC